jgi:hypothetical protein
VWRGACVYLGKLHFASAAISWRSEMGGSDKHQGVPRRAILLREGNTFALSEIVIVVGFACVAFRSTSISTPNQTKPYNYSFQLSRHGQTSKDCSGRDSTKPTNSAAANSR